MGARGVAINFVGSAAAAPGDKPTVLGHLETLEKYCCYPKELTERGKSSMFRQVPADDVEQIKATVNTRGAARRALDRELPVLSLR